MTDSIKTLQQRIVPILQKYQVKKAGIFGSYATDQQDAGSDLDLLVELNTDVAAKSYFKLKNELESAVNTSVDLVEYDYLHPVIRQKVLNQQIQIL